MDHIPLLDEIVGLAQFGEFGFVLARLGESAGVIDAEATRPLLAAGIASMFLTPVVVRVAPHLSAGERLLAPLERLIGVRSIDEADEGDAHALSGHVVIVGYGVAGRLAARALSACKVRYVVLELNAETVRTARVANEPVYYGDATSEEALGHAHIEKARALLFNVIDEQIHEARANTQTTERTQTVPRRKLGEHEDLADLKIESALLSEASSAVGRSAVDLGVRQRTGALIVAVRRAGKLLEHPDPHAPFEAGDIVYLAGATGAVQEAVALLTRATSDVQEAGA